MKIGPCGFEFDMHLHRVGVRERIVQRHVLLVFLATNKPEAPKVFPWAVAILGGEWGLWVLGVHGIQGVHGGQSGNGPRGAMGTWVLGPRPSGCSSHDPRSITRGKTAPLPNCTSNNAAHSTYTPVCRLVYRHVSRSLWSAAPVRTPHYDYELHSYGLYRYDTHNHGLYSYGLY